MKLTLEQAIALKAGHRPSYGKAYGEKSFTVDMEQRRISGYAAAFNNIDDEYDVLIKGCFAKSIAEHGPSSSSYQKIIYLWVHEREEPIGKVVKLLEDDFGLYFEAEVDPIPEGDRALIQYSTGTLNQHSIGFRYVWDKCDWADWKGQQAFVCNEVRLFEISVVPFGCNENTPFLGMKGMDIETERKIIDRDTEDFINRFDPAKQLKLRQLISKHIALAQPNLEPGNPLKKQNKPLSRKERNEKLTEYLLTKQN